MSVLTPLPCPFCGDPDPAVDEVELRVWALVCNGCGCTGPIEDYDNAQQSAERAIELWNRRGATDWEPVETVPDAAPASA
jgi:Lar family restriction alleviation protein